MQLRFTNRRAIHGLDGETDGDKVWLRRDMFNAEERAQVCAALRLYDSGLTEEAIFSRTMEAFDGLAETPIEWWDVVGEDGSSAYQIWLYGVDSGTIFKAGTTEVAGQMCQFGWDGDDDDLAGSLEAAHAEIKESDTRCALKRFDFGG